MADKAIIFISDAHLSPTTTAREKHLVEFLQQLDERTSHLYILGDLFDFWFEYRNAIPAFYLSVLASLRELADKNIAVTYLRGNHDFWMRDYLTRQAKITIAPDTLNVYHQGKKIHLFHGDGINKNDIGYRLMKKIFRFKPNIWLYSLLPVDLAYYLALKSSHASRKHTENKEPWLTDYYNYASEQIKKGSDAVIIGHAHRPEIKELDGGLYINTGDWIDNYSYVILENGRFELRFFPDDSHTA